MFIEYHHGYRDLKERLIQFGYSLNISKPTCNPLITPKMQIGDIIAKLDLTK